MGKRRINKWAKEIIEDDKLTWDDLIKLIDLLYQYCMEEIDAPQKYTLKEIINRIKRMEK